MGGFPPVFSPLLTRGGCGGLFPPGEAPFEDDDLLVQMRPDWHAALTGEGELCCVRAAMLLRNSVPSRAPDASARIVVSTCDTDAVLIALVNTFPGLYVELSHFDRKLGAASYVDIDTHMLKTNIEKRLRITTHDFVVIAISKGSDFVKQSVAGIANWHDYVKTCSEHIRARGAVVVAATAREAHVNVARVDTMLHSLGVLSKRVQVSGPGGLWGVSPQFYPPLLTRGGVWGGVLCPPGEVSEREPFEENCLELALCRIRCERSGERRAGEAREIWMGHKKRGDEPGRRAAERSGHANNSSDSCIKLHALVCFSREPTPRPRHPRHPHRRNPACRA